MTVADRMQRWIGQLRRAVRRSGAGNMACGQRNLAINGRSATWVNACVGRDHAEATAMRRESDGATVCVPCHSMDSLLDAVGRRPIEMLHIDCQRARKNR